jgi:hypothetical protein
MKEEILRVAKMLENGDIDEIKARDLLLSLLSVVGQSGQCEHRFAFLIRDGGGAMQCSDCGEEI